MAAGWTSGSSPPSTSTTSTASSALVRDVDAEVPIGVFLMIGCGDHPRLDALRDALGDGLMAGLVGDPQAVAERVRAFGDHGITRVQLTPYTPDTLELLAPHLATS